MGIVSRRDFLRTAGAAGALAGSMRPGQASARTHSSLSPEESVHFLHDGLMVEPLEYAKRLTAIEDAKHDKGDVYMAGGAVQELEYRFASVLGKEAAVFVPTGTLANHLAIRRLAGETTKVLVQAESHIYSDSLDCVQTLSHLNLVPLARGRATFTRAEVDDACRDAIDGPYPAPVGAISIECPVRRQNGEAFDYEELKRIADYARQQNIRVHLDGARLYIASAYTGVTPDRYAALADTVYISLYKYFGAASGAVLAGSKHVIDQVAHDRKVFGSGLYQAWPFAAVALDALEGFPERFARAVAAGRELFERLRAHPRLRVESFDHGTNVHRLTAEGVDGERYRAALEARGIGIRRPGTGTESASFFLLVNESLNRRPVPDVAEAFVESLSGA